MRTSNFENNANNSNGSHSTNASAKSNKSPGRNDTCTCGSGKKFKRCCMNKSKSSSSFPKHRFQDSFGLQVHIDNECKMTFSVPKDRFIDSINLIREKGVFKEHYLALVPWSEIEFNFSDENVFAICFHILAATILDGGELDPYCIPEKSWIMNIPSGDNGKIEALCLNHEDWYEKASSLTGYYFE